MDAIKIVETPPGEAPQEIREAWVGLRLPLFVPSVKSVWLVGDVVTRPVSYFAYAFQRLRGRGKSAKGYLVNTQAAIALLRRTNPKASEWWRENHPKLLSPDRAFLFPSEACEAIEAAIISIYYNTDLGDFSTDGTFSVKTSWYDEFGTQATGFITVHPDDSDYQFWQWIMRQRKINAIDPKIVSGDALDDLRKKFRTLSA